jgi:nitroreductase
MNDIIKAIKERRSCRSFKPDMPKHSDLEEIIEAGLYAPNSMGKQDAAIIAITNKELRDRISESNRRIGGWDEGFDPFYGAPVIMLVIAKNWPNGAYDGALIMQNLMLAADSLGLGSIWINRAREELETDEYKQFIKDLGIEGDWIGVGHCAIGYPDGEKPEPAVRKPGRVYWVE